MCHSGAVVASGGRTDVPGRLRSTPEAYDLIVDGIGLMLDRTDKRNPVSVQTQHIPFSVNDVAGIQVREWQWSNGNAGAGWARETQASAQQGGCAYGENVWLRRLGVAQPAGAVTERGLPGTSAAITTGYPSYGQVFGPVNDLYITTRARTVIIVRGAAATGVVDEHDFGATGITVGVVVFNGTGVGCLYVADQALPIHEWNGTLWSNGNATTERVFLDTVEWNIGNAAATGGLAGLGGSNVRALVGTDPGGSGVYQVTDNPKDSADWSSITPVGMGGTQFSIAATAASAHNTFYGTGMGVWGVDGLGRSWNFTKWVEDIASLHNCQAMALWAGQVWFATEHGLFAFTPNGERVDLGSNLNFGAKQGETPIYGRPRALAVSEDGLYVGYYNEETDISYVGILLLDPSGDYRWSMAEAVLPSQQVTFVKQVSDVDGNPNLWIGTIDASGFHHLWVQILPKSGDPETDAIHGGVFRAAENWTLFLSRFNADTPNQKIVRRMLAEYKYIGSSYPDNTLALSTSVNDGAFVTQGTATSESPWSGIPVTGSVRGTSVQVKLSVHNATTAPVVVRSIGVDYSVTPKRTKVETFPVIFGDGVELRNQNRDVRDPAVTLAQIESRISNGPYTITKHLGRTVEGFVEDFREVAAEESEGQGWTVHGMLTLSTSRTIAAYDLGATYDSDDTYS